MSLQEKLEQANKKAEAQKAERRHKVIKGSHLVDQFVAVAKEAGCDVRENTGFHVIVGPAGKSVRIYVAKRGGIVDLLGFTVQDEGVRQISPVEAKEKHMGRVQGRLNLELADEAVLATFKQAVAVLCVPAPVVEVKERKPRKVKEVEAVAETPAVTEVTAQA